MRKTLIAAVAIPLTLGLLMPTSASAIDEVNTQKIRDAVTVSGILAHQRVFQRIADQNGGTRASGTPGYDASAQYVARTLRRAGYKVRVQEFDFPFFQNLAPGTLDQISPTPTDYETGTFTYSGSGDVTGVVVPIDLTLPPTPEPSSTSGCEPADFPTAPATPAVALLQRGSCDFGVKVANAAAAGYDAAIIFNEGQAGRTDLIVGTLGTPQTIPVVGLSFADGNALAEAAAGSVTVRVTTSTESEIRQTANVIADSPKGKNADEVVVVGAHLDSVPEGPGINDNGSGSATILEIAEEMAELGYTEKLQRQVRFAFWGAEEFNLLGSEYYVANLSNRQLAKIYANLNFDMLGSTNYVRFVYDGDGSDTPDTGAGPDGSDVIEDVFTSYFESQGLASEPTAFDGRSDYGPFIAAGIPAGGLFSGAEDLKTPEQAAIYGGTAGVPYDPCYHEACDDITNLSTQALIEMGDAAAHAVWTLAKSKTGIYPDGSRVGQQAKVAPLELPRKGHVEIR